MELGTVYRVQGQDGTGPYGPDEVPAVSDITDRHRAESGLVVHPGPARDGMTVVPDGGGNWDNDYRCGFDSLDQLRDWFSDKEIDTLLISGFDVVKISGVKIIQKLGKQVIFTHFNNSEKKFLTLTRFEVIL